MKSSEALKEIMCKQERSKRSLALELDITPQALDNRLKTAIRVETLAKTAAPLGYKVMLISEDVDVEGFVIDG